MNEHNDVMCQVRESFSGLHMDVPVEKFFAASRVRRRRRLSGLTAAAAATAGAAAAVTLALGGSAPTGSGNPPPTPARSGNPAASSPGSAQLAAFSVTSGPGHSTTLVLRKGARLDPSALRQDLAEHGIPALVTVGTFCRSTPPAPASTGQVLQWSTRPDGSDVMVIDGSAMPSGTRLSIGYLGNAIRLLLIKDGAALSCSGTSQQPAVHIAPSGTRSGSGRAKH